VSKEYQKAIAQMQLIYSKKAYPWDNACIESFPFAPYARMVASCKNP